MSDKKDIIKKFFNEGILLTPDLLEILNEDNYKEVLSTLKKGIFSNNFVIANRDVYEIAKVENLIDVDWKNFEKIKAMKEKGRNGNAYENLLQVLSKSKIKVEKNEDKEEIINKNELYNVEILIDCEDKSKKREVKDFVEFFNSRYNFMKGLLEKREEMINLLSVKKIKEKKDKDNVSLIGLVKEKNITKNGNIIITVEDPTGEINVLINKNKPELYEVAKDIVLDEVIGIIGVNGVGNDKIIYVNNIIFPDIPKLELKKAPDDVYAIFISDIHVGSKDFLEKTFLKFIKWIRGEVGNKEHQEIAKKVKYIFIAGDIVDGVGIYPNQEDDLEIKDIVEQYNKAAEYLAMIPKDKVLIISGGNHDAIRMAEPQPKLDPEYAKAIYDLPNAFLISNPGYVRIHKTENFSGFDVLIYHGYSFDYFINEVESIRNNGGYDRADLMMRFLLKRRHLAPTHGSTLYVPGDDNLIIKIVPDFFVTGHIHKVSVSNYKSTTMICGSCWQRKTAFQEKVGHHPEPGKVPIVNLRTRTIRVLNFLEED